VSSELRAAERDAIMPLRVGIKLPHEGLFGWMPGYLGDPPVFGAQADRHLDSMRCVRDFTHVRVWERDPVKTSAFCTEQTTRHGVSIEAAKTARAAIDGADVICTVTGSPTPIVFGDWITPGQHINAVGTSFPGIRELDGTAVARGIGVTTPF
jgi:ornithine cyclodeaminase/alanine dehydrogenase-like protein (mu-crystallin family)